MGVCIHSSARHADELLCARMEFPWNLHAEGGGGRFTERSSRHLSLIQEHKLALESMRHSVSQLEEIVALETNICLMPSKQYLEPGVL